MKKQLLGIALAAVLLAGCQSKTDIVREFIPGTYVHNASGEYSVAQDTLFISAGDNNAFSITRKVTYQAVRDGKVLPPRHLEQHFKGVYDAQKQFLNEVTTGRLFFFDPLRRELKVNTATYQKLN
jgi:hypothetical protein